MTGQLTLNLAVPERRLIQEAVDEVQIPAADGSMGVLPGHAPLMTQLGIGVLSFTKDNRTRYIALHGGLMEVLPDHVRILADGAEWAEEIDVKRAREARQRATDLLQRHDMEIDVEWAQECIRSAQARIDAYDLAKLK
jgi:F-type H+-transporting ATPase subunit epsilon